MSVSKLKGNKNKTTFTVRTRTNDILVFFFLFLYFDTSDLNIVEDTRFSEPFAPLF